MVDTIWKRNEEVNMLNIGEIVDEAVDVLDRNLSDNGVDLSTDELDDIRDVIQEIIEIREGV